MLFWPLALAVALWVTRRLWPHRERLLFTPIAEQIRNPVLARLSGWLITIGLIAFFGASIEFVAWLRQ